MQIWNDRISPYGSAARQVPLGGSACRAGGVLDRYLSSTNRLPIEQPYVCMTSRDISAHCRALLVIPLHIHTPRSCTPYLSRCAVQVAIGRNGRPAISCVAHRRASKPDHSRCFSSGPPVPASATCFFQIPRQLPIREVFHELHEQAAKEPLHAIPLSPSEMTHIGQGFGGIRQRGVKPPVRVRGRDQTVEINQFHLSIAGSSAKREGTNHGRGAVYQNCSPYPFIQQSPFEAKEWITAHTLKR